MENRTNTTFGWVLFSGIVLLGGVSLSSHYFQADKPHSPEGGGFVIEGADDEEGAEQGPALATLLAAADVAAGEKVFAKCSACHTVEQGGANGIGPNLYGVMGEAIATGRGGFAFSADLKAHGGEWSWENMDAWLASPRKFASGTKMSFPGLSKAEDRANLMAWLNTQGSNIPLPPPPAEPAEGEELEAPAQDNGEAGAEVGTDPADAGALAQPDPAAASDLSASDSQPE
ncbi:c-type cytochrome [Pseudoblastomonas halimionae]|uniref:C-type cytochrome n=1 Tax=Alteriqipengyuania halimionae TaxID=1926630 RepID=A0A6I4U8D0_9SPHN|nr:c-type cytochrome [Alteriqipengyuania halimionae]MXP10601.1 c-type cytochrome [Alteriqipengyuania halimionae]